MDRRVSRTEEKTIDANHAGQLFLYLSGEAREECKPEMAQRKGEVLVEEVT